MMKKFLYIFLLFPFVLLGQKKQEDKIVLPTVEEKKILREGNDLYNKQKFVDAEVQYKKTLETNPTYARANYNLGNAIYEQNRFKESIVNYEVAAKIFKEPLEKAEAFHNLGNALMLEKKYPDAVKAYKNSLRNNPTDEETRYNLALAKKMLEQEQDQDDKKDKDKDKDNKDQKDKNDQNKDNKQDKNEKDKDKDQNQDQNKDEQDKKNDKDQGKNQDKEEKQKPKPKPNELSKQQMEQLLEAMNNEENKTQKKVNAKKARGRKVKQEKDW